MGNIVRVEDSAQDTLFFNNTAVRPVGQYEYDALYRLVSAAGRERVNQGAPVGDTGKWDASAYGAIPAASNAVWEYTEGYSYDKAGNLLGVDHDVPSDGTKSWEREYVYATDRNRLDETTVGSTTDAWPHDDRGNMLRMPHLRSGVDNLVPDFRDRIAKALLAGSSDEAVYLYDGSGERVRKVVRQGQVTQDRRYVGGFEIGRRYESGDLDEVRETLHVSDGKTRVVLVETLTFEEGDPVSSPTPRMRFQLGNHLGSVALEVDEDGAIISYEEYHPYGSTAWWAGDSVTVSQKRYRYTGMERDEETGLQCHGVRYYAPWLGRWMSADPIGLGDGLNRYGYAGNAPTRLRDSSGMSAGREEDPHPEGPAGHPERVWIPTDVPPPPQVRQQPLPVATKATLDPAASSALGSFAAPLAGQLNLLLDEKSAPRRAFEISPIDLYHFHVTFSTSFESDAAFFAAFPTLSARRTALDAATDSTATAYRQRYDAQGRDAANSYLAGQLQSGELGTAMKGYFDALSQIQRTSPDAVRILHHSLENRVAVASKYRAPELMEAPTGMRARVAEFPVDSAVEDTRKTGNPTRREAFSLFPGESINQFYVVVTAQGTLLVAPYQVLAPVYGGAAR